MQGAGVLMRAAAGNRPRVRTYGTFWRHFAVLTINTAVGHIRDHLFLGREGTARWKSWKFKVVHFGGGFETGSMTGLMT